MEQWIAILILISLAILMGSIINRLRSIQRDLGVIKERLARSDQSSGQHRDA
jgi:putative exporter of polyketide antibiotics